MNTTALSQSEQLPLIKTETDAMLMHQIISLPKIDLHRHLTGSISPAVACRIAAKHDVKFPTYIAAELSEALFSQTPVNSHAEYFSPWPILNRLFASLPAVEELLRAVIRDCADDNVAYAEIRLGPRGFLGDSGYSFEEFVQTVSAAVKRSDAHFGTTTRCILGIPRHVFAKVPIKSRNKMFASMLNTIQRSRDCFVGVDLNGDEVAASGDEFVTFFKIAREMGLPATVHAGEIGGSAGNVAFAVGSLGASRIGHGIEAAKNPSMLTLLAQRRCVLEICPSSNRLLGVVRRVRDLPLAILDRHNVPFVICTDNPARCRVTLSEEIFSVAKAFAYSIDRVREITMTSLQSSFADAITKKSVAERLARP